MRLHPRNFPIVALLLAWLLPLQGFAAISGCAQQTSAQHHRHAIQQHAWMAHEHCTGHGTQGASVQHHGSCADCCMAAVAQTTSDWTPPRAETPALSLPQFRALIMTTLDRLDRPPRKTLV